MNLGQVFKFARSHFCHRAHRVVGALFLRISVFSVSLWQTIYFVSPSVSALWAEMRCAKKMGRKVIRMTKVATTLVTGRSRGRVNCEKIQIGNVDCCPAVNVVTITSSNERANASIPPASNAVPMFGKITWRNVWNEFAPRSMEASICDPCILRKRARTLLYTTTTQNVA